MNFPALMARAPARLVRTPLRWLKRSSLRTSQVLGWGLLVAGLACAAVVLSLRYWFLPNIEAYREDIAAAMSQAAGLPITIGRIAGDWDGMRPHLKLENVTVHDKEGRQALDLGRVDATLSWRSLATLGVHFHALDIHRPQLDIRRGADGVLSVAGIRLERDENRRGGFTDWLLEQRDIEIHDAALVWTDELRQAPALALNGVALQIASRGERHRFGLRAAPPSDLATPVDVRGDVRGRSLKALEEWNGKLFVQVDRVDLNAWAPWLDVPVDVARGSGALRTWLTFNRNALREIVADVGLIDVKARLRSDLAPLELERLTGRIAWESLPGGFEVAGTALQLAGPGVAFAPTDFRVKLAVDKTGVQVGEARAGALELQPLITIADRLPLADALRARLVALSPRGRIDGLAVKWKGEWPQPESFSVAGAFAGLGVERWENIPGVSGLSGRIDGNEKGGTLVVSGNHGALDMPRVFASVLPFDTLSGQIAWSRGGPNAFEVRLNNVAFANADAAGAVSGSWRSLPQGPGEVDLTGTLARADARSVSRYIPITMLKNSRPWFERAFVAGLSNDVKFRMKGRLEDFPYAQDKRGVFSVVASVTGGTLDYAERWPRIEDIEGELTFRGSRMEFNARQGTIFGVRLAKVRAEIPDVKEIPRQLTITGEAEGATGEFLAFIAKSPVLEITDRFTEGIQAQGQGRLALKLALPIGALSTSRIAGSYQFINNTVAFERDLPPFEQVNGRLDFSESGVRVQNVSGVFLGGPATLSAETQRGAGINATAQGRVNVDAVRKAGGPAWLQHVRGTTDWRGTLALRRKVPHLVIESSLQGLASTLPAPLGKTAAETIPLKIERRAAGPQQDRISFAYGDVLKGEIARRNDGRQLTVERGILRLGPGELDEPDKPGIWVKGGLRQFNLDDWLAYGRGREGEPSYVLSGLDVKIGQMRFLGRDFQDVGINVAQQRTSMQIALAGSDVEGSATWRSEGRGRLTARLKRLTLPAESKVEVRAAKPVEPSLGKAPSSIPAATQLPALDVIVEQFQSGDKQLGRLELAAAPHEGNWRIEKLRLSNPDGVLSAEGVWQEGSAPRTQLNVRMDVSDVGRTLGRWGYPTGVRRGTAKIEGQLAWAGGPQDFDYPTLSGQLGLEAANGQFIKLDPGMAKLLGILSLQALPRRITLDFRDVFSEGFHFDTINGALKVERGLVTTENFRVQGPAARVLMTGAVDLTRETQKLRIRVTPQLSEGVAIAGALIGGPIAGVATYLAQKILRDPIEALTSYDYNVTGGWSDPQVARAERPPPPPQEGAP